MGDRDITKEILSERIEDGFDIIEGHIKKRDLKITDKEKMDFALRCGVHLAIEKNKSYRMSKIER